MNTKSGVIIGATFALPLISSAMPTDTVTSEAHANDPTTTPTTLTESALDAITAGTDRMQPWRWLELPRYPIFEPIKEPPTVTTMAIGEEGDHYPIPSYPILKPIEPPPTATTLALGEEGGYWELK